MKILNDVAHELIITTAQQLQSAGFSEILSMQEATWLVEHVLKTHQLSLNAPSTSTQLTIELQQQVNKLVKRRVVNHEPLAYILGTVPFGSLALDILPPILIPRPETEEWCLKLIDRIVANSFAPRRILDLCSGSGCISLLLAKSFPQAHVVGVDINEQAVQLAKNNAAKLEINNVEFVHANIFTMDFKQQKFDLLVSNPPYISALEWQQLPESVKNWEDQLALTAPQEGLAFYTFIANQGTVLLSDGQRPGWCVVEVGATQGNAVKNIFMQHGWVNCEILQDLFGNNRVVFVQKTY